MAGTTKGTLQALAIKANPLVEVLRQAVECGAGLEAASWEEVQIARAAGCDPSGIVSVLREAETGEDVARFWSRALWK